jgi:hypothetical protein
VQAFSPTPGETHLSQTQFDSVVAAAIGQWAAAGATAAQLAALHATTFSVSNLSGNTIGEQTPGHITIDDDAAGHGWFIDPTPNDNSEFRHAQNAAGTDLLTDASNAAAGHLDLLTAVSHELGHVLGLPDSAAPTDAYDLMYINLVDGERRLPSTENVTHAGDVAPSGAIRDATSGSARAPAVNNAMSSGGPAETPTVESGPTTQAAATAGNPPVIDGHAAGNDTLDHAAVLAALRAGGLLQGPAAGGDVVWTREADAPFAGAQADGSSFHHDAVMGATDGAYADNALAAAQHPVGQAHHDFML